jgi:hypothetical protein
VFLKKDNDLNTLQAHERSMTLVFYRRDMGRLAVYDMNRHIDIKRLQPEFSFLVKDPYAKSSHRRIHTAEYKYDYNLNTVTGPILPNKHVVVETNDKREERKYPLLRTSDNNEMKYLLSVFLEAAGATRDQTLFIQAQRTSCFPGTCGEPCVEKWHQDMCTKLGILCMDRHNIVGGINEFKKLNDDGDEGADVAQFKLEPGHLIVCNDKEVRHRLTPIMSKDCKRAGHRDLLIIQC